MASRTSISHARVLVDWEQDAIPKLLKLEKVMPGLVQRKVVPKKLSKGIVKNKDFLTLLGILKAKPIEVFVKFLQALADTFPECEAHRGLVLDMRDSLERMHIPQESDTCRVAIQEVIARAELKDQPTAPTPLPHLNPGRNSKVVVALNHVVLGCSQRWGGHSGVQHTALLDTFHPVQSLLK